MARWLSDEELTAWIRLVSVVELLPGALDSQLGQGGADRSRARGDGSPAGDRRAELGAGAAAERRRRRRPAAPRSGGSAGCPASGGWLSFVSVGAQLAPGARLSHDLKTPPRVKPASL